MKRVLAVFPSAWDARQLPSCRPAWAAKYDVVFTAPRDEDVRWDFDVLSFIDRTVEEHRGEIDGVMSSSDYPGAAAAAAIAIQLRLPGSPPAAVIRAAHKYYSRMEQRAAVPEATPGFHLVDPLRPAAALPAIRFPCFVKPVKGSYSVFARRMETPGQLQSFLAQPAVREFMDSYLRIFHDLTGRFTSFEFDARHFIAEDLLHGTLVTVEGFAASGEVEILGVVDSVLHPATGSFVCFDYPSSLSDGVQGRMADIARRAVKHLGLDSTLFNIEMVYDPASDRIHIIEINPRMCGQFADLYEKVDGTNSYEIALAIATGERPPLRRRQGPLLGARLGQYLVAASFPLRVFEPARVLRAPGEGDLRAAEAMYPGALVWSEVESGQELTDFELYEDGHSHRYAVINLGAATREELQARFDAVHARLGFELKSL